MLPEAELLVMTEVMLVEVLGRIREPDRAIVLPPVYGVPGADGTVPLSLLVERYVWDEAGVPAVLGDASGGEYRRPDLERGWTLNPQTAVRRVADAVRAAASGVTDGDRVVPAPGGDRAAADYLLDLTVSRSLLAHYVAAYLGSTACPLPEELARPLWERTHAEAEMWRRRGAFRDPLPIPDRASWRDTFLQMAGHEPHPLGH